MFDSDNDRSTDPDLLEELPNGLMSDEDHPFINDMLNESTFVLQHFDSQEFDAAISNNHSSLNGIIIGSTSNQNQFDLNQHSHTTATGPLPATDIYPGAFHFYIKMDEVEQNKNKWAYSQKLNKLYIRSERIIPVPIKWDLLEPDLVVRALPVFSDAQHMKKPVKRCYNHSNPLDSTNKGFVHVEHILRSENPGAHYEKNEQSERCSVVVPLEELQPGCSTLPITYKFMCQTTCSGGMDRRPITVLFTLERSNGEVLGRQKLNVKICSCPKRDMEKEEKNNCGEECSRRRSIEPYPIEPHPKRIKIEANEEGYNLQLKFSSPKLYKSVLKRVEEALLRHSRTDRSDPISIEASKLLGDVDKLKTLKQ